MKLRMIFMTIFALIIGGLIGTSVTLLYAPRSGRATRALLRSKGVQIQEKVAEDLSLTGNQVKGRIDNLTNEARHKVVQIGDQLKDTVSSVSLPFPTSSR
jgi:gas vesicle protein